MRNATSPSRTFALLAAALGCLLLGCATSKKAGADLTRLEEDHQRLRGELGQKTSAAQQAFTAASQGEARAGVTGASCSQVSLTQGAAARTNTQHARVELNGAFVLRPRFAKARPAGPVQVTPGTCEVAR